MIRFASPEALFPAALALVWVAWRLRGTRGPRRWWIRGATVLTTLAVGMAVAGAEIGAPQARTASVFLLDRSRSVENVSGEDPVALVRTAVESMEADDRAGLVVFAAQAATEVAPSASPAFGPDRLAVPRDATDLEAAVRRGLADLPAGYRGRLVLLSDGLSTRGDVLAAATAAARRNIPIDVVPLVRAAAPEVAVTEVRVPRSAEPGQPIEVRAATVASRDTRVLVQVRRDGELIASGETELSAGDDVLLLRDEAPLAGAHRYDVRVEPLDSGADGSRANNEGGAFLRVRGASRALVVAEAPPEAEALAQAIDAAGLEVVVGDARSVPLDLAGLSSFDLLVLSDLPARSLTEAQLDDIAAYVRDLGGGLLMTGGRGSFGLGGYAYTPVEEVLPATFDLRNREDRASLAMVIAIDQSGSMGADAGGGRTKLDLANEAAARSASLLSPFDRVAVAHVDTEVHWTLPMSPVEDPARVTAAVRRAQPGGGGILVNIALRAGFDRLEGEATQLKHLLLFSDGSDSQEMGGMRSLASRTLRDHHITTSVVSMGNGPHAAELEAISRSGEGRFYIVEDLTELPRIFTQETMEASRSAIIEEPFSPVLRAPSAVTEGIDWGSAPRLRGYVVMNPRPSATRLLDAKDDDPLLLVWQHGLGRSATLSVDTGANLGRPWVPWGGMTKLLGQLARDLSRPPEEAGAVVSVDASGGAGRVRVEALDDSGRYRNHMSLQARIAAPDGSRVVPLQQTGAGRYEVDFDAHAPGAYLVTIETADGRLLGSAGTVRPQGNEMRGDGTDTARLQQIATLTGGTLRSSLDGYFDERPPPVWSYRSLWRELVAAALLLLLLLVALRRLVVPWPAWLQRFRRRSVPDATPAGPSSAVALAARKRAAPPTAGASPFRAPPGGGAASPFRAPPDDAPKPSVEPGAITTSEPKAPSTLAEQLLAKKKRRR